MPIEIKELIIRTVVDHGEADPGLPNGAQGGESRHPVAQARGTDDLVQECVRQVLAILARDKER